MAIICRCVAQLIVHAFRLADGEMRRIRRDHRRDTPEIRGGGARDGNRRRRGGGGGRGGGRGGGGGACRAESRTESLAGSAEIAPRSAWGDSVGTSLCMRGEGLFGAVVDMEGFTQVYAEKYSRSL